MISGYVTTAWKIIANIYLRMYDTFTYVLQKFIRENNYACMYVW